MPNNYTNSCYNVETIVTVDKWGYIYLLKNETLSKYLIGLAYRPSIG